MDGLALCLGLAVSGVCLPVPGTSAAAISAGGWVLQQDEDHPSEWWASAVLGGNRGTVIATVGGRGSQATSLIVAAKTPQMADQIRIALDASCGPADAGVRRSCRLSSGATFWVITCGRDAWILSARAPSDLEAAKACWQLPPR